MKKMFPSGTAVQLVDTIDSKLLNRTGTVVGTSATFTDEDFYFVRLDGEPYYGSNMINITEGCIVRKEIIQAPIDLKV